LRKISVRLVFLLLFYEISISSITILEKRGGCVELALMTPLGRNKDLILQFIDFFCRPNLPYNDEAKGIQAGLLALGRLRHVYCITTQETASVFQELKSQISEEFQSDNLQLHEIALPLSDINVVAEEETRRLVFEQVKGINQGLIIASGGRKNLTHALIEAGLLYGCLGYLSITAPHGKERRDCVTDFQVYWLPIERILEQKQEYLDLPSLKDEIVENFRSLYILPLNSLNRLKQETIGRDRSRFEAELMWLQALPKADLHCHLGGEVQPKLLHAIGTAVVNEAHLHAKTALIALCSALKIGCNGHLNEIGLAKSIKDALISRGSHPLDGFSQLLKDASEISKMKPYEVNACLLSALFEEDISELMWQGCQGVISLQRYMQIGELGGSNLLQTRTAIQMTLNHLLNEAIRENVRYIEIRCSPKNYTRGGLSSKDVMQILIETAKAHESILVNFIIMGTRHKPQKRLRAHVNLAISFAKEESYYNKVCGFDLAGDENIKGFFEFRKYLKPLYDNFVQITIHAGEVGETVNIRDAIYELNARRIGHGLKLIENKEMMNYVRDAGIAIEMCPTSNMQTNGYHNFAYDPHKPCDIKKIYPLKSYMMHGIAVTVNTDNRGISRTTLSEELLRAAQLTEGGLSQWEVLQLIKNGFKAAFLPLNEKNRLFKQVDKEVFGMVVKGKGIRD